MISGLLSEGYAADILIFDEKEVQDLSPTISPMLIQKALNM